MQSINPVLELSTLYKLWTPAHQQFIPFFAWMGNICELIFWSLHRCSLGFKSELWLSQVSGHVNPGAGLNYVLSLQLATRIIKADRKHLSMQHSKGSEDKRFQLLIFNPFFKNFLKTEKKSVTSNYVGIKTSQYVIYSAGNAFRKQMWRQQHVILKIFIQNTV